MKHHQDEKLAAGLGTAGRLTPSVAAGVEASVQARVEQPAAAVHLVVTAAGVHWASGDYCSRQEEPTASAVAAAESMTDSADEKSEKTDTETNKRT